MKKLVIFSLFSLLGLSFSAHAMGPAPLLALKEKGQDLGVRMRKVNLRDYAPYTPKFEIACVDQNGFPSMNPLFLGECGDLPGVRIEGSDLTGVDLRGSSLRFANLSGSKLDHANLSYADLVETNLNGATLKEVNLYRADLQGVKLHNADLRGANLSEANLTDAYLVGVDLSQVKLEGARFNKYTHLDKAGHAYLKATNNAGMIFIDIYNR